MAIKISKKLKNKESIKKYWEEYCFLKYFDTNVNILKAYDFRFLKKRKECWMIMESLPTDLRKLLN